MKGADHPGSGASAPPVRSNGTHRATKKNGDAPKSRVESGARRDPQAGPEPPLAPFSSGDTEPIDAPMWPLHSALWFQPDLAPSAPLWSGLAIEHHNRVPAPDFLHKCNAPLDRADNLDNSPEALTPVIPPELPRGDLAPLGWDPRAVFREPACPKEERE